MTAVVEKQQMDLLDRRLGSIESKLDRLIRIEERQNTHDDSLKRAFERLEKCEDRLRELEINDGRSDVRTTQNSGVITTIVSAVVSVGVGLVIWTFRGN